MSDQFDPADVAWVLDDEALARCEAAISAAAEIVLDLETTGLDEHAPDARAVLASLTLPTPAQQGGAKADTWVVPLSHPDSPFSGRWRLVLARLAAHIALAPAQLTNHNVKFDARWVAATTGVELASRIGWDTNASARLLDENASARLKDTAPARFGVPAWDEFDLSRPGAAERVPLFDLGLYAARDTYWTWRLACAHRDEMFTPDPGGTTDLYEPFGEDEQTLARIGRLARWVSMPTVANLTAIETRGIRLDRGWARKALAAEEATRAYLSAALADRYAGRPGAPDPAEASFAPTSYWFAAFAATAVEAGELTVAELTPKGKPSWGRHVLVRQARAGSEVAEGILEYRKASKRAEYLRSWLDLADEDGLVFSTYNIDGTITGRLSSARPNMQQVTAVLKPAFVPRSGYLLAELDYSQIELRVAAMISGSEPMKAAFARGDDLHRLLASRITGKAPEDVTPEERQAGKSANFGLLYGMGAYGFRRYAEDVYGVSFTDAEAHAVHRTFFETWEGLAAWHARTVARVAATGYVVSPIGRVRRLPEIRSDNPGAVGYAERAAVNAPVQGFASDLMQMASAWIGGLLPGSEPVRGAAVVATVHDSIVVELAEDAWREALDECVARMTGLDPWLARFGYALSVPLAVDAKVGTRWGVADVATLGGGA